MATTSPTTAAAPPSEPGAEKDWPAQATEAIVTQVGKVRDKTTGPALKVARYTVYAAFAVSLGTVAAVILVIGAVRALNNYLPGDVWAADVLLGSIFLLVGLGLWFAKARANAG